MLPSLRVPTTLIWGKDDGLLPVAYAEALQKKIAGSKLMIIDGAAHMPHRQQPERFLECLSKSSSPSGRPELSYSGSRICTSCMARR